MRIAYFILAVLIFSGCSNEPEHAKKHVVRNSELHSLPASAHRVARGKSISNVEKNQKLNCDSIIRKLIFTSNYRRKHGIKYDFDLLEGNNTDTGMLIQIVSIFKETRLPEGWLQLNYSKRELLDVTLEDSVTKLNCDTNLINIITHHCRTNSQLFDY